MSESETASVEAIAAKLTKAQRDAMLGGKAPGSAKPDLVRKGLMILTPTTFGRLYQRYAYDLTPLGIAVRALLERNPHVGE